MTFSWEEQQTTTAGVMSDYDTAQQQHDHNNGQGLGSILAVLDTLADACLVTFNDRDTEALAAALGAVWATDGALRRVSLRARPRYEEGDGGASSPDREAFASSSSAPVPGEAGGADGNAADLEFGQQSPTGLCSSGGRGDVNVNEDASAEERGNATKWVEDSRIVGVVRSLAQRCQGLPARRVEETGTGCGDGDRGADGDRRGSSTEGVGASVASEDPQEGAAWPLMGALSLLELAEAVLDAVGPEATGDILEACPQLLENMPQKVRTK